MKRCLLPALLIASLSTCLTAWSQQPPPSIRPDSSLWESGGGFSFDLSRRKNLKTRQSISGMACNLDAKQRRICLMAFDEGSEARYAYVEDNNRLIPDKEPVLLRLTGGESAGELDAESAATDGRFFYVAGSHSAKRSDCASNPDSRHVIRFRLDPATGRGLRTLAGQTSSPLVDYADSGRLWAVMQTLPGLAPYVGERKCLGSEPAPKEPTRTGQQGVNIEGMAVRDGQLYFGFRGPVVNGMAKVMSVDTEAFFSGADPKAKLTDLALGEHSGIRDMVSVSSGILLLAGPDDTPANHDVGWTVWYWDSKTSQAVAAPRLLAALDLSQVRLRGCDAELKPESITVLEETPQAYKLLVLSDGLCDGGPMSFTIPR